MTKDELLELADRCEREEASRELDCAVAKATGWSFNNRHAIFCWRDPGGKYQTDFPYYTTSLDAAVTLVPEGWRLSTCLQRIHGGCLVAFDRPGHYCRAEAPTEPQARCAAALRARASTPTQGEG